MKIRGRKKEATSSSCLSLHTVKSRAISKLAPVMASKPMENRNFSCMRKIRCESSFAQQNARAFKKTNSTQNLDSKNLCDMPIFFLEVYLHF